MIEFNRLCTSAHLVAKVGVEGSNPFARSSFTGVSPAVCTQFTRRVPGCRKTADPAFAADTPAARLPYDLLVVVVSKSASSQIKSADERPRSSRTDLPEHDLVQSPVTSMIKPRLLAARLYV